MVVFTKYYYVDQVNDDEMGRAKWLDKNCGRTLRRIILLTYYRNEGFDVVQPVNDRI
jgi:hypothetical protein